MNEDSSKVPDQASNVTNIVPLSFKCHCATPTFLKITGLLDAIAAVPSIGVIIGASGVGKSVAARAYADDYRSRARMIEVTLSSSARRDLLDAILDAAEIYQDRVDARTPGSERVNLRTLTWKLADGGPRLLIIDEAQKLETKAIELLGELCDAAPISIALIANPSFTNRIFGKTKDAGSIEFQRLIGRIGVNRCVDLRPEDIDKICESHGITSSEARKLIHKWASRPGGLHQVRQLLAYAKEYAAEQVLTLRHLQQAAELIAE